MEPALSIASPIHPFVLLQVLTKNRINDTTHQFKKLFHFCFSISKSKAIGSLKERPSINQRLFLPHCRIFCPRANEALAGSKPSLCWGLLLLHIPNIQLRSYLQCIRTWKSSQTKLFKSKEIRLWKPVTVILDYAGCSAPASFLLFLSSPYIFPKQASNIAHLAKYRVPEPSSPYPSTALKGQPTRAPAAMPITATEVLSMYQPVMAITVVYMQKLLGRKAATQRKKGLLSTAVLQLENCKGQNKANHLTHPIGGGLLYCQFSCQWKQKKKVLVTVLPRPEIIPLGTKPSFPHSTQQW